MFPGGGPQELDDAHQKLQTALRLLMDIPEATDLTALCSLVVVHYPKVDH